MNTIVVSLFPFAAFVFFSFKRKSALTGENVFSQSVIFFLFSHKQRRSFTRKEKKGFCLSALSFLVVSMKIHRIVRSML